MRSSGLLVSLAAVVGLVLAIWAAGLVLGIKMALWASLLISVVLTLGINLALGAFRGRPHAG